MSLADKFREEALVMVQKHLDELRSTLSYQDALSLPAVACQDIVVAGKEALLTIYRQADLPFLAGQVLVTAQIARHALGGVTSFQIEKALVFSPQDPPRAASDQELADSRG